MSNKIKLKSSQLRTRNFYVVLTIAHLFCMLSNGYYGNLMTSAFFLITTVLLGLVTIFYRDIVAYIDLDITPGGKK